ncbi:Fam177 family, partial [Globisporangium splendens]
MGSKFGLEKHQFASLLPPARRLRFSNIKVHTHTMAHDSTPSMVHPIASPPCPEAANQSSLDDDHEQQEQLLDHKTTSEPQADGSQTLSSVSFYGQQAWTWLCWSGEKTWDGLDFAGEVVANFLGLTRSKYQWMIDLQAREEADKKQRRLEARQRRQLRLEQLLEQEKRKLRELEAGAGDREVTENV